MGVHKHPRSGRGVLHMFARISPKEDEDERIHSAMSPQQPGSGPKLSRIWSQSCQLISDLQETVAHVPRLPRDVINALYIETPKLRLDGL